MMVFYLDLVFTQLIEVSEFKAQSDDVTNYKILVAISVLALTVIVPVVVMIYLCAKFDDLTDKDKKRSFNTLLLRIDKTSRLKVFMPTFYFFRRFFTAAVLVFWANQVVKQYVGIISLSFLYFLYLSSQEPYQRRSTNMYVTAMEFFYFLLTFVSFILTDASADVEAKIFVAWLSAVLLVLFIISNIGITIQLARKDRHELKTLR